jgi:hypothetical protein
MSVRGVGRPAQDTRAAFKFKPYQHWGKANAAMSGREIESIQESPLLIKIETEFTAIGFGNVIADRAVMELQRSLNSILYQTADTLPGSLADTSKSLLDTYSGRPGDFFSLFYVPIWSFLHWALANHSDAGIDLQRRSRTTHALSLFLHLWDDHLCDGQLRVDIGRLQLRTTAWQTFTSTARDLCDLVRLSPGIIDEHVNEYLSSQSERGPVVDLQDYLQRFSRQVAIWTIVPRLLDHWLGHEDEENSLQRVIDRFACCWRLLDDIQDIHIDLLSGSPNAVWYELDSNGRERWDDCHARAQKTVGLKAEDWQQVSRSIHESGALTRLLSHIDGLLEDCSAIAQHNGWQGLVREFDQSRVTVLLPTR